LAAVPPGAASPDDFKFAIIEAKRDEREFVVLDSSSSASPTSVDRSFELAFARSALLRE
jgi:hypothetical protein